jgi:hypothetical protein
MFAAPASICARASENRGTFRERVKVGFSKAYGISRTPGNHTVSYRNAQYFVKQGDIHRERSLCGISMAMLVVIETLCIQIAYKHTIRWREMDEWTVVAKDKGRQS